jgi:hypothetical protein
MQVYIIRANDLTEVDGALCLLNLDAQIKQNVAGKFVNVSVLQFLVCCVWYF